MAKSTSKLELTIKVYAQDKRVQRVLTNDGYGVPHHFQVLMFPDRARVTAKVALDGRPAYQNGGNQRTAHWNMWGPYSTGSPIDAIPLWCAEIINEGLTELGLPPLHTLVSSHDMREHLKAQDQASKDGFA